MGRGRSLGGKLTRYRVVGIRLRRFGIRLTGN